jgi:hypothetical protein
VRIFEDGAARKRLQPGQLLGIERDESVLRHDCLTPSGNAGSPLVDVESKLVVGVHYAGRWAEFKRGDAVPLWPAADHRDCSRPPGADCQPIHSRVRRPCDRRR